MGYTKYTMIYTISLFICFVFVSEHWIGETLVAAWMEAVVLK